MNEEIIIDIYSVFYTESKEDIDSVRKIIPDLNHSFLSNSIFGFLFAKKERFHNKVFLGGKETIMYKRTYFLDENIKEYEKLTDKQKLIFDCLNTTQSNGYKREESLKKIIKSKEPYIPYFVLRLLGDYVIEIQETILANNEYILTEVYKKFIAENNDYYENIRNKVWSYWSANHNRTYPKKENYYGDNKLTRNDYPGIVILKNIDAFIEGEIFTLDFKQISDKDKLYDLIEVNLELEFTEGWGRNLDALNDVYSSSNQEIKIKIINYGKIQDTDFKLYIRKLIKLFKYFEKNNKNLTFALKS